MVRHDPVDCPFQDTLLETHAEVRTHTAILERVEGHVKEINGTVGDLKERELRVEGGMIVLRWIVGGLSLAVMVGGFVVGIMEAKGGF